MRASDEAILAEYIDKEIKPFSFRRVDAATSIQSVPIVSAWRRRTLNMNRGIALVRLTDRDTHPGEVARKIKKSVGGSLGYIPFLYELGLQLVFVGQGDLSRAVGLYRFLDTINTQTVVLQSIHLVDVDAWDLVRDPSILAPGFQEELGVPAWAQLLQQLRGITPSGMLSRALGLPLPAGFGQMRATLNYSRQTGRAVLSVRTWAQSKTGPFIDAIEKGIDAFLVSG